MSHRRADPKVSELNRFQLVNTSIENVRDCQRAAGAYRSPIACMRSRP